MSDFSEMPLADKHRKKAIRRSFKDFLERLNSVADEVDTVFALGRVACAVEVLAKEFDPSADIFSDASCDSKTTNWLAFDAKLGMMNEQIERMNEAPESQRASRVLGSQ